MSETIVEKSRKYVEDEGSYLSLLSHELYLKFFWKVCASEHYDRMSYVSSITPVTRVTSYRVVREMEAAVHPLLKVRSVYPPR